MLAVLYISLMPCILTNKKTVNKIFDIAGLAIYSVRWYLKKINSALFPKLKYCVTLYSKVSTKKQILNIIV